jgi:nucleoid-associated protein EbfC
MFKGLGQIASLMKQAQEMKGRMQEIHESLKHARLEGSAGGGMVVVEVNGHQQLLSCRIDPGLTASGDREMLEDLVVGAVNQALEKARVHAATEMSRATGGLELEGLGDTLSKLGLGGT